MMDEKVTKDRIQEIEKLHEQRKKEFQETKNIENRLEATKEFNIGVAKQTYSKLSESVKKSYGFNLEKNLEELTPEEIKGLNSKLESALGDMCMRLENYLRTGKVEELGDFYAEAIMEDNSTKIEPNENPVIEKVSVSDDDSLSAILGDNNQ